MSSEEDVAWALAEYRRAANGYTMFENYYLGYHNLLFATEKFRNAFGNLFRSFSDNLCPAVVDAVADRLIITGFDGTDKEEVQKVWDENRLSRASGQVHQNVLKTGDTFVLVWPDAENEVRIWPQSEFRCSVQYNEEVLGKVDKASKLWQLRDGRWRLNLYFEDRIERYVTRTKIENGAPTSIQAFDEYTDDLNGFLVPNPYGWVPMFHFANNVGVGEFGFSELKDVIPLQDALNKSVCDMLVAMEFQAFPQRWATGLQVEVDPDTGKPLNTPFTPGADRIWTAAGDVKFGQFPASELKQYIDVQDSLRIEIARVTGTPLHYFDLGTLPSGESLKVSEGRLIKKIEDRQVAFGDTWKDILTLALIQKGQDIEPKDSDLSLLWKLASPHNPLLDAEVQVVKQQVGVSQSMSLSELGYTQAQIEEMKAEKEEEDQRKMDMAIEQAQAMPAPAAFGGKPPGGAPATTQQGGQKPRGNKAQGAKGPGGGGAAKK